MTEKKDNTKAMLDKQIFEVKARVKIIESSLDELKLNKLKPKNRTAISKFLADRISKNEGKTCSYTTILRNRTYNSCIDKFMKELRYEEKVEGRNLESRLLSAQLEIRKLREECILLNRMLKKSLSDITFLEQSTNPIGKKAINKILKEPPQDAFRVIQTLLKKLDLFPDQDLGIVIDEYDGTTVFSKENLPEYFKWLKDNNY
jgi:hypothetical protein